MSVKVEEGGQTGGLARLSVYAKIRMPRVATWGGLQMLSRGWANWRLLALMCA